MKRKFVTVAVAALALSACAGGQKISMTPMEIQAMQQRDFEVPKSVAFASTVSVFQDLGYQMLAADLETGFINAQSNTKNSTNFWEAMGGSSSNKTVRATAYVEQLNPTTSRVRLNFVEAKDSSTFYGQDSSKSQSLLDAALYQGAFERISEAVFVRSASN
ncbi:hypothetical protein [Sphingomicrobium arenosum]|uniref:hypothetical protein n=1 Tax=Sphingomicrobium arenosum TaxID=2233861 RepID=UPI002240EFDA|nr:hypothetical protein [Sphingomicrobium arenosum]